MPLKSLDSFLWLKRTFRLHRVPRNGFAPRVSAEPRWFSVARGASRGWRRGGLPASIVAAAQVTRRRPNIR